MAIKDYCGYARVSTRGQSIDRQIIALQKAGVEKHKVYVDYQSGKDFSRTQYNKMIQRLTNQSTVFVSSIDRLGRNYEELIDQWRFITKEIGADIVVLDMPLLDTRRDKDLLGTFISDMVMSLLSYVAETERLAIRERQREGILAAKQKGVRFGRPEMIPPTNFEIILKQWRNKEITYLEAARQCGMSKSTFYRKASMHPSLRVS